DRTKGYFPVPALKYLRGSVLSLVQDALLSERAIKRDIFHESYLRNMLRDPDQHLTPLRQSKVWQAALLNLWLESNGI
ncbi:MAG: hypothetical protein KDD53_03530, partial [Bdellovibrionales bacterium]|nr:hypothetical protein [Bdellovibrionales bacterium]